MKLFGIARASNMTTGAIHALLACFNNIINDLFTVLIIPFKVPTGVIFDWIVILIFICTMLMLSCCFLLRSRTFTKQYIGRT